MKLSVSTTRKEMLLGCGYWLLSLFVLPTALQLVCYLLGISLSLSLLNILFFAINFICVVSIFHKFLLSSVKVAWAKPWRCLWCVCKGLLCYYAFTFLVSVVIAPWVGPNFSNVNDDAILELAKEHTGLFAFGTVFLVPVTEEVFYRGLLFQGNFHRKPKLAFWLSVFCFAAIHILDFIGSTDWKTLLACFVQYLPAGIALANAYVASDTIVTPILMHITINLIAVTSLTR
ncbi:MAG: CPBP family intramembrane metalloprotease [Oscillospiraceae bacterium]|nr:CPBP family intramembrane metalloprotease [Oscillospiraceae bacterium]